MQRRSFLFLQGVSSPFFERLGRALRHEGHAVSRINFCGGDRLFWGLPGAWDFPMAIDHLDAYLSDKFGRYGFTDVLLFGDCRPLHLRAMTVAERYGARTHVFEEGYLRPHWITMEEGGVNGRSRLPGDPDWYLETASALPAPPPAVAYGESMAPRVKYDLRFHLATRLQGHRYPGYRSHRPWPFEVEIASWARRLATLPVRRRQAEAVEAALLTGKRPFFLFALQLDSDAQIRVHSPFKRMAAALEPVIASFAANAPADHLLVVKNHPLDNGLVPYRRIVQRLARQYDVAGRVIFIDGGSIDRLIDRSGGVVVVNSTVGLMALRRGRPVAALGRAVYRMPGLTFPGPLDLFWQAGTPAEPRLLSAFSHCLVHFTQIGGNFYTEDGMAAAVDACTRRLLDRSTTASGVVIPFPGRAEDARVGAFEAWHLPAGVGLAE